MDQSERKKHIYPIYGMVATTCVWISLWFLVDLTFQYMHVKNQILAYILLLIVSLSALYRIACENIEVD